MKLNKKVLIVAGILAMVTITTIASAQYDYDWSGSEAASAGFMGLSLLCCGIFLIPFILGLILGIWVYKDAEKRGKSGVLWLLIVWFVAFPIGLIIWLVVRPPIGGEPAGKAAGGDRRCPNCGRTIPMDARACPYCAKKFEE